MRRDGLAVQPLLPERLAGVQLPVAAKKETVLQKENWLRNAVGMREMRVHGVVKTALAFGALLWACIAEASYRRQMVLLVGAFIVSATKTT